MKALGIYLGLAAAALAAAMAGCSHATEVKSYPQGAPAGFTAVEAEGRDEATGLWKEIVHEKTGMVLRLIPAGKFDMGESISAEDIEKQYGGMDDWYRPEHPQHLVKISKAFYMGKYEVTQKQWQAIMGNNPSNWKSDNLPVEQVSWNNTQEFCKKAGDGLRLPTEAEWEYACRAGSTGKWCFGDDDGKLGDYSWYTGNAGGKTHEVGTRKPNAWGLYDMHGNVYEWCSDWYGTNYYEAWRSGATDPQGPSNGQYRVVRGGSWSVNVGFARCANRVSFDPIYRYDHLGFRVVVSQG